MARGRHYAKLSLSNAVCLSFSDLCILLYSCSLFESLGFFVETSKSRPTHARLRNRELADEAELVSLSVG